MFKLPLAAALALGLGATLGAEMAAAQGPTKLPMTIVTREITAFCMRSGMVRHPNFPRFREKYNLQLDPILMVISQVPVTVANGDVPIGECSGISTVMNAWSKGAKNLIIFAMEAKKPVYHLVTKDIDSLAGLRGKKLGIPGIQSAAAEALEMIMKRGANMLPSKDYNFVSVGAGNARVAALATGTVDALPSTPPNSFEMKELGYKIVADEVDYVPEYGTGAMIVSREWAEKNRDLLVRFIKATIETGQYLKDPANKKEVIAWFAQNLQGSGGKPLGDDFAAQLYEFFITGDRLAFNGYIPISTAQANLDILRDRGYLKDTVLPPLGQIIDFSYLNTALKELGLPQVAEYPRQ